MLSLSVSSLLIDDGLVDPELIHDGHYVGQDAEIILKAMQVHLANVSSIGR